MHPLGLRSAATAALAITVLQFLHAGLAAQAGRAGSARPATIRVVVTTDAPGRPPVHRARVLIYEAPGQMGNLLPALPTTPPLREAETNADGSAQFTFDLTRPRRYLVEVVHAQFRAIGTNPFPVLASPNETAVREVALAPGGLNDSLSGRPVTVAVCVTTDGGKSPVAGASVTVDGWVATLTRSGSTDARGCASLDVPVVRSYRATVRASRPGFDDGTAEVALSRDPATKPAPVSVMLVKRLGTTSAEVMVTVTERPSGRPLAESRVVLIGDRSAASGTYEGRTDETGRVSLLVREFGRFKVQVRRDTYEAYDGELVLPHGTQQHQLDVQLADARPVPTNPVTVTVLSTDRRRPVRGALVEAGGVVDRTDAQGRVVVAVPALAGDDVTVSVSAPGFHSTTQVVPLATRGNATTFRGSATVLLTPGEDPASPGAPLRVRIQVRDSRVMAPVVGAQVVVSTLSGDPVFVASTAADGDVIFESSLASVYRAGLTVDVDRFGYLRTANSLIPASLLEPSNDERLFSVTLDPSAQPLVVDLMSVTQEPVRGSARVRVLFDNRVVATYDALPSGGQVLLEDSPLLPLRNVRAGGLTLDISHPEMLATRQVVAAAALAPAVVPARIAVALTRDWSRLGEDLTGLEQDLSAVDAEIAGVAAAMQTVSSALKDARSVEAQAQTELSRAASLTGPDPARFPAECARAEQLLGSISDAVVARHLLQASFSVKLKAAATAAAECTRPGDGAFARREFDAALGVVAQAGAVAKAVRAHHQELEELAKKMGISGAAAGRRTALERARTASAQLENLATQAAQDYDRAMIMRLSAQALHARFGQALATARSRWSLQYDTVQGHAHREGLPAALATRLNQLAARHSALTAPSPDRGPVAEIEQVHQRVLERIGSITIASSGAYAACPTEPNPYAQESLDELYMNLTAEAAMFADVRARADACEKRDTCGGTLPAVRALADAGRFTEADAVIAQARARTCDVEDAQEYLDYQRTLLDGRRVIVNAVAQCQFADALALADKMPLSFRQQSLISNVVIDARRGRAAELDVEKRLEQARALATKAVEAQQASRCGDAGALFAEADAELSRADVSMSNFACLKPRIDAVRADLSGLRAPCGSAPPPTPLPAPPPPGPGRGGTATGKPDPAPPVVNPKPPTGETSRPPVRPQGETRLPPATPPSVGDVVAPPAPAAPLRATLDCGPELQLRPGRMGEICDVVVSGWLTSTSAPVRVDIAFLPPTAGVSASPGNTSSDPGTMHSTASSDYPGRYVFQQGFSASDRVRPGTVVLAQIVVSQVGHGRIVLPLRLNVVPANTPYGDGSGTPVPPAVVVAGSGGDLCVWRYKLTGDAPRCFHVAIAQCGRYGPPYELIGANMTRGEAGTRADQISRYFNDELGCRSTVTAPPPAPPPGPPTPPTTPPTPPATPPPAPPPTPDPPRPARTLSRFGIEPRDVTIKAGDTVTLRALGIWSNAPNATVDLTADARWSPSNRITTTPADAGRRIVVTATHAEGTDSITITVAAAAPVDTVPIGMGGRGAPPPPPPADPPTGGRGGGAGPGGGPAPPATPVSADVAARLQKASGQWFNGNADVCWTLNLSVSGGDVSGGWSYAGKIKHQESGSFQTSYKNGELSGTFTGSWHSPGCVSCNKGESGGTEGTITIDLGLDSVRVTTVEGKGSAVFKEGTTRAGVYTRKPCK